MTRTPLMAGNWKMNLDHLEANHLVQGLAMALSDAGHDYSKCEVLVIPPFTDIRTVQTIVDADDLQIKYGAQDVSIHDNGAYTGEISTEMLTKLGVTPIEAVGQKFDPNEHNAVMHMEDPEKGEGEIVQEFQKGFKMGDRVIRFSLVQVAN